MEYPEYTKLVKVDFDTGEIETVGYEKNDLEKAVEAEKELRRFERYEKTVRVPCFGWKYG